ncbi:chemotaxis response regulator protein-glutamate methylesterase [Pelagicoccus sp. SDUM812002]|uniref:protein-glutamate methylesterase/protein-glutamine glutaminase n=1 Tax=Pelagicoccus sp. SDUM812002 TaxID=3041266 RepID=UPI00280E82F9|nr:chemotaxis response regulator protein-glutamate methylesterase [Pelagicoccus sp. SDUM812002]MDQ8187568.1 chemotaxis response regulator protein-glutamate methylesterase [Pelagicoccus sp. SDUM812002]
MPDPTKISVMIVDDSSTARRILSDIVNRGQNMEVIAAVADPFEAVAQLKRQTPDVMILDVQMPRMDGITFLKKLMVQHPLPVIMCSSLTEEGSKTSFECLENGAVEIIGKPRAATKEVMHELELRIHDVIRSAAVARFRSRSGSLVSSRSEKKTRPPAFVPRAKLSADEVIPPPRVDSYGKIPVTAQKIIAVGASTGGTDAIKVFLEKMPENCPGIIIVQHMPEGFTASFANRLDATCAVRVKEARNGDLVEPGQVLIAPGSHHMMLRRAGNRYTVEVRDGPLVSRHRPSVDVLFRSVALNAGRNAVGVILTGMGDDGAVCMKELRDSGAYTFAQNRESCVVFGMPNEAIKHGGVDETLPLDQIGPRALAKALG